MADTYLLPASGVYKRVTSFQITIFKSVRVCLSTGVLGCALSQLKDLDSPYPCQIFLTQEVKRKFYKLISPGPVLRWLNDNSFYLPHEFPYHLSAVPAYFPPILVTFDHRYGSVIRLLR